MVALKLATTRGGTPPVAQIAGLASLGALGLLTLSPIEIPEAGVPAGPVKPGKPMISPTIDPMTNIASCPAGYEKITPWPGIIMCQESDM